MKYKFNYRTNLKTQDGLDCKIIQRHKTINKTNIYKVLLENDKKKWIKENNLIFVNVKQFDLFNKKDK